MSNLKLILLLPLLGTILINVDYFYRFLRGHGFQDKHVAVLPGNKKAWVWKKPGQAKKGDRINLLFITVLLFVVNLAYTYIILKEVFKFI